jgi:glycosyltransferase involved in cell wall biosynthesis
LNKIIDYRNNGQNEELNLPSCLEKLSRFDQIIVVDSGSTDDTMNIATAGAEVLQFHWNGKFKKNAIGHFQNANLLHEWIYF